MQTLNLLVVFPFLLFAIIPAHAEVFNIPSGDVTALINAINAANSNGEKKNTINLKAGTYTLTAAVASYPPTNENRAGVGLPIITKTLTLRGAGVASTIIERNTGGDPRFAPFFRIITVAPAATLNVTDLTIRNGRLPFPVPGGGSLANEGTVNIQRSAISGDSGSAGGAISNLGTMTITNSFISGGANGGPFGSGGGISNSGTLIISNSSITGTTVESGGGGIANGGTLRVANSTVSGSAYSGGGILNTGALTLVNSTITRGHSVRFGGGAIDNRGGQATITNSTIADNDSSPLDDQFAIGGIQVTSGTLTLQNTILARNSVLAPGPPGLPSTPSDCSGIINSLGNNLIGDPTGCIINLQPTDVTGDSGLDAFVDLGVPGTGHIPLMAGSPAIDAGNPDACPATDQLGLARVGNCDIGAIEFQPVPVLRAVVNVRPYSDNININPNGTELIRVAILGTSSFDTSIVDPATVRFGPNQVGAEGRSRFRDTNGDGLLDLVLRFPIQGAGIQCNDSFVSISGQTVTGEPIQGIDTIHVVGCN